MGCMVSRPGKEADVTKDGPEHQQRVGNEPVKVTSLAGLLVVARP